MREVVIEAPSDGRGKARGEAHARALTLVEKLHREQMLTYDEFAAAGALRNLHFLVVPPSEGVSSYGQSTGRADPTRKGDRKAKRITGIEVREDASVSRGPSRSNRSDQWAYRDALFAMAGVHTDEGDKVIDPTVTRIMLWAITDSEHIPTQAQIGSDRSSYATKIQLTAVGASFVRENLRRLAMHFRMVKGETKWG